MKQFACKLTGRKPLTDDVSLYRFEAENEPFVYSPGQFVSFVLTDPTNGARIVRSYSVAGAQNVVSTGIIAGAHSITCKSFELIIIHVANGKGTSMLKSLPLETSLKTVGPAGNLTLRISEGQLPPLVFCANSTGIAPFRAMLQYLAQAKLFPEVSVFWGLKTVRDLYLAEEFVAFEKLWQEHGSTFVTKICLSRETEIPQNASLPSSCFSLGRIQSSLEQLPSRNYQVYICGGKSFVLDTKALAVSLLSQSTVFVERFN